MSTFSRQPVHPSAAAIFMLALISVAWLLSHRYSGLVQDGELYAMQAMSHLQPGLRSDLYLAHVSQDRFTLFSPLYAFLIRHAGLWTSSVVLFVGFRALFFLASWALVRRLTDSSGAWLAVLFLVATTGEYGAYGVFNFAESYLSARSLAEALVIAALAVAWAGRPVAAWLLICFSFAMHPLMTLPGALLLLCLRLRPRSATGLAAGALCVAAVVTLVLSRFHLHGAFETIDGEWLEVVRQRSQFLFLQDWQWRDWEMHLRAAISLVLIYLAVPDSRIRQLCAAAALVGASGLVLAWIAAAVGPIAILLQSQPWRWFWLTSFASIALLGPLVAALWSQRGAGRFAAALMVVCWVFPVTNGLAMAAAALAVWMLRSRLGPSMQRFLEVAAALVIFAMAAWTAANSWSSLTAPLAENIDHSVALGHLRAIFQLRTVSVGLVLLALWWLRTLATNLTVAGVAAIAAVVGVLALPGALSQRNAFGTPQDIRAFDDWRNVIPADSNVLPVPTTTGAAFEWFTLQRPGYLSMNQSAGVVFSRATAEEVARRSEVLRPVADPDWQIRRRLQLGIKREDEQRKLTDQSLRQICTDPVLGFVISSENLNYPSVQHLGSGTYKGSHLYDCEKIRDMVPN